MNDILEHGSATDEGTDLHSLTCDEKQLEIGFDTSHICGVQCNSYQALIYEVRLFAARAIRKLSACA